MFRSTLAKIKRNQATETNETAIDKLTVSDNSGMYNVTEVMNEIYDIDEILENSNRSIFLTLLKKPSAIECKLLQRK